MDPHIRPALGSTPNDRLERLESGFDYARHMRSDLNQAIASMPELVSSGYHSSAVESLRRPNLVNESIVDLAQQTSSLSLSEGVRPNPTFNALAAGDVRDVRDVRHNNTPINPWISSGCHPSSSSIAGSLSMANPMANTMANTMGSTLSPFAKEFVPRTSMTYSNSNSMTNGGRIWSNNLEAKNSTLDSIPAMERDFEDYIALSYLREFIDTITVKPNRYENGIDYLTGVINTYIDEDESVMSAVVNTIVDQAIIDPQFRYSGVRLCIYFMENLRYLSPETTFKLLLFRRCHRENARRDVLVRSSDDSENYLRGLTMFIGDLYSRCSAHELAEYLPQLLTTLMSNPHKENLKCVCQVLKLCGATLEKYYEEKNVEDMNRVMSDLEVCANNADTSAYTKELITNIINMQKRGWTAAIPLASATNATANPYLNASFSQNNGTYGDYYEEYNSYSDEEDLQTSYDFGQCGDEEDNEVCEAFEEFLKNSGQTN